MKLLRKISVGTINGVRGGFKNVGKKVRVMTIAGIAHGYKEKVSETMGVSYAFNGEFRAINLDGEECAAAVAYVPEPVQGMLRAQIDSLRKDGAAAVEFGFHVYVVPDEDAIKGYVFEVEPLIEAKPSTALENLTARIAFKPSGADALPSPEKATDAAPAKPKRK